MHHLIAYTAYGLGHLDEAQQAIVAAEAYPDDAQKDLQFSQLKAAIAEAIAARDAKINASTEPQPSAAKKNA